MSNGLRIVLGYFIIASLWIILSDEWISQLDEHLAAYNIVQMSQFKGMFFVTVTAVLLYIGIQRSEDQIRERSNEFERLYRQNPNPMLIYDPNTLDIISANFAAQQMYKLSEKEFIDRGFKGILQQSELQRMKEIIGGLGKEYTYTKGWHHVKSNGEQMIVNIASHGVRYKKKNVRVLAITDVTELEENKAQLLRVNHELKEERQRQYSLMNSFEDAIWSMTEDFILVSFNQSFSDFYFQQYGKKPGVGCVLSEMKTDWKVIFSEWDEAIEQIKQSGNADEFLLQRNGEQIYRSVRPYAIRDSENNQLIAVGVILRDVTSTVTNRKMLEVQNQQLRKISSVFSHEMRRPVTTILGLIDLIDRTEDTDEREEAIRHLKTVSDEIDTVIRDIIGKSQSLFEP